MRRTLLLASLIPYSLARPPTCSGHFETPAGASHNVAKPSTLQPLLDSIEVMQSSYFELWTGTWPSAIDWTAAVLGTHVSATLSTLVSSIDHQMAPCFSLLTWENVVNEYFAQTSAFYFGENAFGLRNQAYDDMLWVVLGWLENIKFQNMHTELHWQTSRIPGETRAKIWHGAQFSQAAAHRSRIFYEIASHGWDTSLCSGGMVWNPQLKPYKNAITNELFISASIAMYLYYPGDDIDSPFLSSSTLPDSSSSHNLGSGINATHPHSPLYLSAAVTAYKWLKSSGMTNSLGLYQDGFHVRGWQRTPNGTHPGTGECDDLNTMVYTYNQGVILSGLRGLYLATAASSYLDDGHSLIESVIVATGWRRPRTGLWHGLGRDGILEEFCDHRGDCSQNGHTFKGIFFHHLAEFCRPLWPFEEECVTAKEVAAEWEEHIRKCAAYGPWIRHNAHAALVTRDEDGKFGMWWGRVYGQREHEAPAEEEMHLPPDAVDYRNYDGDADDVYHDEKPLDSSNPESSTTSSYGSQRPLMMPKPPTMSAPEYSEQRKDVNDRGRGRTVETQSGGLAVLRALWQWEAVAANGQTGTETGTGTDRGLELELKLDREDL